MTGRIDVVIRSQGSLLNHINNHPSIRAQLWKTQVQLGIVPYDGQAAWLDDLAPWDEARIFCEGGA